jgi:CheY-like chemotaxis protein
VSSGRRKPRILVVDDEIQDARALRQRIGKASADVAAETPDTVTKAQVNEVDVVLVDYKLGKWKGARAGVTSPPNGLALSAILREQVNQARNVTAVALYSGEVDKISGRLPAEVRGFAVARLNNLEWVFEKRDPDAHTGVISLAQAIQRLPSSWPVVSSEATHDLHRLLGLKRTAPFFETAADDITACHPPIHELSTATHALALVRWLAHRILPYPAFLDNEISLAARLRINEKQLKHLLSGKSKVAEALRGVEYQGILCELYGPHWWRSGLDDLAFRWTDGAGSVEALQAAIARLAGTRVRFLDGELVPGIDESYRPIELVPLSKALRLQVDDWPPFADDAWANRDRVAESDQLMGLVTPTDRELLDANE